MSAPNWVSPPPAAALSDAMLVSLLNDSVSVVLTDPKLKARLQELSPSSFQGALEAAPVDTLYSHPDDPTDELFIRLCLQYPHHAVASKGALSRLMGNTDTYVAVLLAVPTLASASKVVLDSLTPELWSRLALCPIWKSHRPPARRTGNPPTPAPPSSAARRAIA